MDMPSGDIPGWYWVSRDNKYSRIGAFWWTCHLVASQDGTGYPGIQDWGVQADIPSGGIPGWYPRILSMGCLGQTYHLGTSQDDTGYPGILSIQGLGCSGEHTVPSGGIPGWYWVSRDTKYSRIGVIRQTFHLGASQDGTGYPGILSIQGLGCSGRRAVWGIPGY